MASVSIQPAGPVLIEQPCLRMRGPLGLQGRLILTERGLTFVTEGLDRIMDDEVWELRLDAIAELDLDRSEPEMAVKTASGEIVRFQGAGAERVCERLEALRAERRGAAARQSFVPGEQVLVQGNVTVIQPGSPPKSGELAITDRRVRFTAGRQVDWQHDADLEIPLAELRAVTRLGMKPTVDLKGAGEVRARLTGAFAVTAYGWLAALVGTQPAGSVSPIVVATEAQLRGGFVDTPGELVISAERLSFVIARRLEPLVGFQDVILELADLEWLELRTAAAAEEARLAVGTAARTLSFDARLGEPDLEALADALCALPAPDIPPAAELLEAWGLSLGEDEAVIGVRPVLHWVDARCLRRAWLLATSAYALVLPRQPGDAEQDAVVVEAERLAAAEIDARGDLIAAGELGPLRLSAVGTPFDRSELGAAAREPGGDAAERLAAMLEARRAGGHEPVRLPGADLRGAELLGADLACALLSGARLDGALLAGALLVNADLTEASLYAADLSGADLTGADLRGADLGDARVEGASLADADLRGADLGGLLGEPLSVAGMRLDPAAIRRSGLSDAEIIQLWSTGAELEGLDELSAAVRRACSAEPLELELELDPSPRSLARFEQQARRELAERLSQPPAPPEQAPLLPSFNWLSEVEVEDHRQLVRFSSIPPPLEPGSSAPPRSQPPPMSLRSIRLVASEPPPAALASEWDEGDELLGVTLERQLPRGNAATTWVGRADGGVQLVVKAFDPGRHGYGLMAAAFRRGVRVMNRLAMSPGVPSSIAVPHAVSINRLAFSMAFAPIGSAVDLPALGWSPEQVVSFFEKLCAAVRFAHDSGVVHRCIRPSNVLLDDQLAPILADFDMVDLPTLATSDDRAGGYRAFAAPEELLGAGTQSPSADIYSLGRVLHYLLLGSEPKEDIAEVPRLLSLAGQPEGLVRIVRKCTVRAPEARYQQVAELLADLSRYASAPERVGMAAEAPATAAGRPAPLPEPRTWLGRRRPRPEPRLRKPGPTRLLRGPRTAVLTRSRRLRVALAGIGLVAAALLSLVPTPVPSALHLTAVRWLAALGVALTTLGLPSVESRPKLGRATFALLAAIVVLAIDPARLASFRLEAALREGDPATRAAAVRALVDMGETSFDGANLAEVDLRGAYLSGRSFRGADLAGANLTAAILYRADFEGANLAGARLDSAAAVESAFEGANVRGTRIRRANLSRSTAFRAAGWQQALCDGVTKMPSGWACVAGHPHPE